MTGRRQMLVLLGVGLAAGVSGVLLALRPAEAPEPNDAGVLRAANLTDLAGNARRIGEWQGRIVVCNFWATWCPPCREEIPALVRARDKLLASNVEFIGIAIDQADKVSQFARSVRISYPVLLADADGLSLLRKLGNPSGGLPFTLVLDRNGAIAHRKLGPVSQHEIEAQVGAMLSA